MPGPFHPISTLVEDGRMVEFKAPIGTFVAPAEELVIISKSFDAMQAKVWGRFWDGTFGYWPDIRWSPTQWREL